MFIICNELCFKLYLSNIGVIVFCAGIIFFILSFLGYCMGVSCCLAIFAACPPITHVVVCPSNVFTALKLIAVSFQRLYQPNRCAGGRLLAGTTRADSRLRGRPLPSGAVLAGQTRSGGHSIKRGGRQPDLSRPRPCTWQVYLKN